MRLSEDESPDVVIARLKANKPKAPKPRQHNGSTHPPSDESVEAYSRRLEAWNSAMAREQARKSA
jgi:hypothetical protein